MKVLKKRPIIGRLLSQESKTLIYTDITELYFRHSPPELSCIELTYQGGKEEDRIDDVDELFFELPDIPLPVAKLVDRWDGLYLKFKPEVVVEGTFDTRTRTMRLETRKR